jgi:ankyrin repeat protein
MDAPVRTVAEVLAEVADVLFPGDPERQADTTVHSRGIAEDTPLHVLAWRRDAAGAAVLIAAGAEVNAAGDMDETPLHVALRNADRAFVDLLVRAGARTDLRSSFGDTAAESATRLGLADWLAGL